MNNSLWLQLQVSDKTAPVRRRSSLIIRHSSISRHRLPPQKYNPTSDKPKVRSSIVFLERNLECNNRCLRWEKSKEIICKMQVIGIQLSAQSKILENLTGLLISVYAGSLFYG